MFGLFENGHMKKVKSHLVNLSSLARVDGHIDSTEMDYILKIGKKHGLDSQEVKSLIAHSGDFKLVFPTNDSERFDQIYDLVEMMLADGVVDDNEMDFCVEMAEKMGFKKAIVAVLVRKISLGVRDGHTRDHIKDEAKAFLEY